MSCGTQCSRIACAYRSETRIEGCQRVRWRRSRSSQKSIEFGDLCVDLARAVIGPDAQHDARRREVVNLPRDLLAVLPADRDALVVHEVAQALAHGNDERLLHGLAADDVVVDVRKGDPRGGARGHVHLDELLRRRIEEVARGDEECGAAVPYLVALAAVWKLSDWQEALREDGVRVGDVIASRLDEGDELKEPILARLHGAPSSRSSFSWIASSIQWCRDGGTRRSASTVVDSRDE